MRGYATEIDTDTRAMMENAWETYRPGIEDALRNLESLPPLTEWVERDRALFEFAYLHAYIIFTNGERLEYIIGDLEFPYFEYKERYLQFKEKNREFVEEFEKGI